jgi:hypothetical protein
MIRVHVLGVGIGVVLLTANPPVRAGERYRDNTCGYSVEIPPRWEEVRAGVVGTLSATASRLAKQPVNYVAAFVPRGKTTTDLPRILVQSQAWPEPPASYEQLETVLRDAMPGALKEAKSALPKELGSLEVGGYYLDREKNRFVMKMRAAVPGVGTVDGISFGMLGRKGMIMLHCYHRQDKFAAALPLYEAFADSFQFDPGLEFKPDPSAPAGPTGHGKGVNWARGMNGGLIGGLVGGAAGALIAGLAWLFRRSA